MCANAKLGQSENYLLRINCLESIPPSCLPASRCLNVYCFTMISDKYSQILQSWIISAWLERLSASLLRISLWPNSITGHGWRMDGVVSDTVTLDKQTALLHVHPIFLSICLCSMLWLTYVATTWAWNSLKHPVCDVNQNSRNINVAMKAIVTDE